MLLIRSRTFLFTPSRHFIFLLAALLFLTMLQFVDVLRVTGNSMMPALHDGQFLLRVNYLVNFQHGDFIVARPPDVQTRAPRFIKRLIALPQDTLSIQNDRVYVNGQVLYEPYMLNSSTRAESFPDILISKGEVVALEGYALAELPEYLQDTLAMLEPLPPEVLEQSFLEPIAYVSTMKLAKGFYFVVGDNRSFGASEDSRLFGPVPARQVLGRAYTL